MMDIIMLLVLIVSFAILFYFVSWVEHRIGKD